ncbi:protein tyrosine phosphatase type iva 2 isoform x3 [Limosa lapponica baueri]|uniref:Protein tyrosine phosphatase type iva 2 isoform x3 n=1 Tax=Limosa lapponica baueri TaxID=1758121 RepID=A0A2I0TIF6_LIMLA|nr:protein tyrosine phosphatase type iva 2 isoform x3 [Limosa lapponica baueri]
MNRPAPVEITYENMRFLITHNPTNATLSKFIEELKKYGVRTLVRVCDATYDQAPIEKEGIQVLIGQKQRDPLYQMKLVLRNSLYFSERKRRGAFNSKQLLYLEKYRPKMRLRFKDANGHCCVQ